MLHDRRLCICVPVVSAAMCTDITIIDTQNIVLINIRMDKKQDDYNIGMRGISFRAIRLTTLHTHKTLLR